MGNQLSAPPSIPGCSLAVNLPMSVLFPGGVLQGMVQVQAQQPVQAQQLGVLITASCHQHWTTTSTYHTGSGKHRRRHTRTHHHHRDTNLMQVFVPCAGVQQGQTLQGSGTFAFFWQAPQDLVPSTNLERCRIRYLAQAVLDNGGQKALSGPSQFQVLLTMPGSLWQTPSGRQEEREQNVTCCCCIPRGKIRCKFSMSKHIVALDRDSITVMVDIDNSEGSATIDKVAFSLSAVGQTKGCLHPLQFTDTAAQVTVPCRVEGGGKNSAQGILQLNPFASPSFQSGVLDIKYTIRAYIDFAWADDIACNFDCFVAHSVDMSNAVPNYMSQPIQFQPMQQGAQPMMAPMLTQAPTPQFAAPQFYTELPPLQFQGFPTGEVTEEEGGGGGGGMGMQQQQQMGGMGMQQQQPGMMGMQQPLM